MLFHEIEISMTRCFLGRDPWIGIWAHGGRKILEGSKESGRGAPRRDTRWKTTKRGNNKHQGSCLQRDERWLQSLNCVSTFRSRSLRPAMLITKTFHDIPSKLSASRPPMRIFVISPTIPNYPNAKFPGVSQWLSHHVPI